MILLNLIFSNDVPHTGGLFYKGGAAYDKNGGRLVVARGGEADFGCYFNLFPYCVYRKYCGTESVYLNLSGRGSYTMRLCMRTKLNSVSILKTVQADGNCRICADITALPEGGYLYFTVQAEHGCDIYGGSWESEQQPATDVKIGIAICTYKRESFVKENLTRIAKGITKEPEWAGRLHAFVVDNADTLEVEKSPYYTVIKNKNLGGSGGFARGMCAVADGGNYTHMLLMDDDISFDFEMVKRTWGIASLLTKEHSNATIGGTMLIKEDPCVQQELGGTFNGLRIQSVNGKLDMSKPQNLIKNENAPKPDYQGWWFCCMPVTYVKDYGLPHPFFIKFDDVEYGLRCSREIIIDNGIAVWHGGFDNKSNPALEYYIKRNEAAVCAMYYPLTRFSAASKFLYCAHRQLVSKDYYCAEKIIRGYEDFIKGSNFFLDLNEPDKLNTEIMAGKPQEIDSAQIEKEYGINPESLVCETEPKPNNILKKALLFTENYTPAFMMKDKAGITDVRAEIKEKTYLKKTVIRYNSATHTGYVCTFDAKRRKALRKKITKIFFRLLTSYGKIKKDYRSNANKMCSREQWNKLFGG